MTMKPLVAARCRVPPDLLTAVSTTESLKRVFELDDGDSASP
jgi:hypothetical protein